MQEDIKKTKRELLGSIISPEDNGDFFVDQETVKTPFFYQDTVTRCCCLNCGYCFELSEKAALSLVEIAKEKIPENWKEYYFLTSACPSPICIGKYENIVLKNL